MAILNLDNRQLLDHIVAKSYPLYLAVRMRVTDLLLKSTPLVRHRMQ